MNKAYEAYCPACPWCARWHCARESCATREITWWLRMRWVMYARDCVNYGCWKFLQTPEDFVTVLPTHFTHVVDAMMWRHRMNWERPSMCSVMLAETITSESTHSFFFFHYGTKTKAERLERENLFFKYIGFLYTLAISTISILIYHVDMEPPLRLRRPKACKGKKSSPEVQVVSLLFPWCDLLVNLLWIIFFMVLYREKYI